LFLDDATKQDLAELQNQRTALGDQFDIHKDALNQAVLDVQAKEAQAHANNIAEEQQIKDLKQMLLDEENKMIADAQAKFADIGDKAEVGIGDAGDAVVDKIEAVDLNLQNNNDKIVQALHDMVIEVSKIAPAIQGITFPAFPTIPSSPPTIVTVNVDTSDLSKESTQQQVLTTVQGYFVNQ